MSDGDTRRVNSVIPVPFGERQAFEKQLLNILPDLRAFARFLTGNSAEADDLVQETLIKALRAHQQFDLKTSIKSWTFTILRNIRINNFRKVTFKSIDDETDIRSVAANQLDSLELQAVLTALGKLSPAHREVITLIRAQGLHYDEAAIVMGCKIGTVKSRLNRADADLRRILGDDFPKRSRAHSRKDDRPEESAA